MIRRALIVVAAVFVVLVPEARASTYAKTTVVACARDTREATFEARMLAYRHSPKLQLRFRLQVQTPETPRWRLLEVPGFGSWITVPSGLTKYTYDKTVQNLLAPANYRAVVDFRWRNARGRMLRSERVTSPPCRLPDARADLVLRRVRPSGDGLVGVVQNRGRTAAGPFAVELLSDGVSLATLDIAGLAPQTQLTVTLPPVDCEPGSVLDAVADAHAQVDEADEENNARSVICPRLQYDQS